MKTYTDEERQAALAVYRAKGLRPAERESGIAASTLRRWAKAAGVETETSAQERTRAASEALAAKREELRVEIMERALGILKRIDEPQTVYLGKDAVEVQLERPPARDVQALATAFGILLDKFRLEQGEATGRDDVHVTVTDEDRRRVAEDIAQAIAEARERGSGTDS